MGINKNYKIRQREIEDAFEFHTFIEKLDREAKYLMYDEGERNTNPEEIGEMTAMMLEDNIFSNIVLDGNRIVGYIVAAPEPLNRNCHCASFMLGILEKAQRQGVGNKLLKAVEVWARENGVTRLEAYVIEENEGAIKLLEKRGFKVEGKKIGSIIINGKIYNEVLFGKIFE